MTDLPEAPASVTYSVVTKNGYPILFTVREMTGLGLIKKMEGIETKFAELGYIPQAPRTGYPQKQKDYVEGRVCPKDGGKLVKKVSKAGKHYIACENGKYNPVTQKNDGCGYIEWSDQTEII